MSSKKYKMGWKVLLFLLLQMIVHQCKSETVITAVNSGDPFWDDESTGSPELKDGADLVDWSQHPCKRACKDDEPPMECRYTFKIEHYYAMSKACYDCPYNVTDCFRPHCIAADGMKRPLVVVNRQMPGPSIEVCEGDRIIVDGVNMLHADSTTLHWHGQHMRRNPYMDGTPYVSQCPILPGDTFRYDFIAANPGSHFWHSHVGFQRGDGMFGPLVVRRAPKRDQLRNLYDRDEHTMIISDWDHELGIEKFLAHYHSSGDNKPPNVLINGLGRFTDFPERDGVQPVMPTEVFNVEQNFKYRFRIMNAEFLNCPIEVSIDNHTLWVVSSDGRDVEPIEARSLVTYAGERFDIIVEMNQEIANYWVRFRGLLDCGPKFTKAYQVAILHYEGAPEGEDPEEEVAYDFPPKEAMMMQINALNKGTEDSETFSIPNLEALDKNTVDNTREPDYQFYISYDFYSKDNEDFHRKNLYGFNQVLQKVGTPQLNHISMKMPTFPLMSQPELITPTTFCNASTVEGCETDYCSCPHVLQVRLGSVVELILIDEGVPYDANHPFHLHGHDFRVIAMERLGSKVTVADVERADREGRIRRKLHRAPIKDTVTVPDGGYTIVRFHADNPGYWLFHCHIEFHSEIGMALVFKIGEHEDFVPVPDDFPRCGDFKPSSKSQKTSPAVDKQNAVVDPSENEVQHVDEKVRSSIVSWLPLILSELRAASSNNTSAASLSLSSLDLALAMIAMSVFAF